MSILSQELIVYYRDGCHLCELVVESLTLLQQELGFEIKQIDIDSQVNEITRKQYNADIPFKVISTSSEQSACVKIRISKPLQMFDV